MRINVQGGTAQGGQSLCVTCKWASTRRSSDHKSITQCSQFSNRARNINENVVECTEYMHRNQQFLSEMKEIAWIITPGDHGPLGFQSKSKRFKDLSAEEKEKIDLGE